MSEKATLLTTLPPVRNTDTAKKTQTGTAATDGAGDGGGITAFQVATYGSFVLTFCLAGFAAVVLFRKATKIVEKRFVFSTKAFAIAAGLVSLFGFFATFLYTNDLRVGSSAAPLVFSMMVWVLVGPAVGLILNYLLTPGKTPETGGIIFDAIAYALIFLFAMLGMHTGIKVNAALVFSLLAGFLFIVPVARSFTAFRLAKVRHPELREVSDQVLIYSLLFIPGLLPVLAFVRVCGLGADSTQFLFNFITFDFILAAGLAMMASADEMEPEASQAEAVAAGKSMPAVEEEAFEPEAPVAASTPSLQSIDPVVAFKDPKSRVIAPKKLPPRKPARPGSEAPQRPAPPKKPGIAPAQPQAPNAPSRLKAPAKPKKRF